MSRVRAAILMAVTALFGAGAARAHVGFLLPNDFSPEAGQQVTVVAAFTDTFPNAEIALKSDGFALVLPDGDVRPLAPAATLPAMSVLEAKPEAPGTYRITTGERLGRKGEVVVIDGHYVRIGDGGIARDDVPDGAAILTSQTATVSDAFIAVPGNALAPPAPGQGRLVLRPTTHPAALTAGAQFDVDVLFDGKPLKGAAVTLMAAYGHYTHPDGIALNADDCGTVSVEGIEPGVYVLMVRHMAEAPSGGETDLRSYTTALTLEVRP
ncbi:MAG: DUF4198 domain-containing protein [Hyphomonas sp.]|nr:DUF4198 domain-containing protein [Hyphomonas sp.]